MTEQQEVMSAENRPFPVRLRGLMESSGTTQTALAAAVGVTRQTISQYANGQSIPDMETFAKIADYFGVSYDYLLGRSDARLREHYSIAEETGLSEKAIVRLKTWCEMFNYEDANGVVITEVRMTKCPLELSQIIESRYLGALIDYIRGLKLLANPNMSTSEAPLPTEIGPAKLAALRVELGTYETQQYLISRALEVFRHIINEIIPPAPFERVTRDATQADIDDFFGPPKPPKEG